MQLNNLVQNLIPNPLQLIYSIVLINICCHVYSVYKLHRSVNTKDSKKWLHTLQSKGVPMLLCLTHADKFYAEHMSSDGCLHPKESMIRSEVKQKLKVSLYFTMNGCCLKYVLFV